MRKFNFNQSINYQPFKMSDFMGVDFANDPSEVDIRRSPDSKNAVASENNVIEKRTGYAINHTFASGAKINGIHVRKEHPMVRPGGDRLPLMDVVYVHVGTQLWRAEGDTWLQMEYFNPDVALVDHHLYQYCVLADKPSMFIETPNNKLYIFTGDKDSVTDGKVLKLYTYYRAEDFTDFPTFSDILTCPTVNDTYIPTTVIARSPTGGGETYEAINLMQPKRKNSFLGTAGATAYTLDATGLDAIVATDPYGNAGSGTVTAQILQAGGTYTTITEGAGLTVNRTTGVVTFSVAPGVTPITGQDNVLITFWKTKIDAGDFLAKAKANALYGFNGSDDYLFIGSCGTKVNYDYMGRCSDFYFSELAFTALGSSQSEIIGYSRIGEYLAIHKTSETEEKTIYLRSVSLDANNELIFPVRQGVAGTGALAVKSFATLRDDPLFLSEHGVVSLQTNDITNVQSVQERGYFINKRLMQETNVENAVATIHDNKYMLFVNGHVYVADPRKKYSEKNAVSESYQYEWYYWEGIDAKAVFSYEGTLYFGTSDGKLCTLRKKGTAHAYLDNDAPVVMYWCTPVLFFNDITVKKSLKNLWIRFAQYMRSGVKVYYRVRGEIKFVKEKIFDVFTFEDIDFTRMTFETDLDPEVVVTNRVERQFMSIQFKVLNDADENMGLIEMVAKYRTNSAYKGG